MVLSKELKDEIFVYSLLCSGVMMKDKYYYIFSYLFGVVALIGLSFCRKNLIAELKGVYLFFCAVYIFYICTDIYECVKKIREKSPIAVKDKIQYSLGVILLLALVFNLLFI